MRQPVMSTKCRTAAMRITKRLKAKKPAKNEIAAVRMVPIATACSAARATSHGVSVRSGS